MLAVVSAVVAFDRWPGANVRTPIRTLVLNENAPTIRVSATAADRAGTPGARAAGRNGAGRGAPRRALTPSGGRVVQPGAGGRPSLGVTPPAAPAPSAPPLVPSAPDVPSPDTIVNSISNPGSTAGQIADGTQAVTDNAGRSLTNVSPDLGGTVTQAGQVAADTVRTVPLPDHVVPGH
jgi:hypothetical protein